MDQNAQILITVSLVILTLFWGYIMLYTGDTVVKQSVNTCGVNQCATNLFTGVKRDCGDNVAYDPSNEVCNSPFVCDNPATPYAQLSDGSTLVTIVESKFKQCQEGVKCNCLKEPQCGYNITILFETNEGNVVTAGSAANRTVMNQLVKDPGQLPIKITNPNTQSCYIGTSTLGKIWPKLDNGKCMDGSLVTVIPDIFTGNIPANNNSRSFACYPPPTETPPVCAPGTHSIPVLNYLTGFSQYQCLSD